MQVQTAAVEFTLDDDMPVVKVFLGPSITECSCGEMLSQCLHGVDPELALEYRQATQKNYEDFDVADLAAYVCVHEGVTRAQGAAIAEAARALHDPAWNDDRVAVAIIRTVLGIVQAGEKSGDAELVWLLASRMKG